MSCPAATSPPAASSIRAVACGPRVSSTVRNGTWVSPCVTHSAAMAPRGSSSVTAIRAPMPPHQECGSQQYADDEYGRGGADGPLASPREDASDTERAFQPRTNSRFRAGPGANEMSQQLFCRVAVGWILL